MRCSECGATAHADERFCSHCGSENSSPSTKRDAGPKTDPQSQSTPVPATPGTVVPEPEQKRRQRARRLAILLTGLVVLTIASLYGLGYRLITGSQASQFAASWFRDKNEGQTSVYCPTRLLNNTSQLNCQVTNTRSQKDLGVLTLGLEDDGSLSVSHWNRTEVQAPAKTTPSPAPKTPSQINQAAREGILELTDRYPNHVRTVIQPTTDLVHDPWLLGAHKKAVAYAHWDATREAWSAFDQVLSVRGLRFERFRSHDVNGDGRVDFLVEGTAKSDGMRFGGLLMNQGGSVKVAEFKVGSERYGAVFNLKWRNGRLISDYAALGQVRVPGNWERSYWKPKNQESLTWTEHQL